LHDSGYRALIIGQMRIPD